MNQATPKGLRLHIGIFGRRNAGKSSLLNAITRQQVAIVSDIAGTTTDPVEKPMEMLPLGPVLFIDTAGVDDTGELGELRVKKTEKTFDRTDLGIIVTADGWTDFEQSILKQLQRRDVPVIVVFNKTDLGEPDAQIVAQLQEEKVSVVKASVINSIGVLELRKALLDNAPADYINNPAIVGDLVPPGSLVMLVVPIDKEAPKGRLILPQVQTIRDLLDSDSFCMVVKERELRAALGKLKEPPSLVVTDSQAFLKVIADTPRDVPVTSFSVLFSRFKGDIATQAVGAQTIETLKANDKVLIAEACTHHPIGEDIGRVKIPRWLTQYVGSKLDFTFYQGHDFPENLTDYKLVINCGGCTFNRKIMLNRIIQCREAGVPITNYGLTIAYSLGIIERALEPFPLALEAFRQAENPA